MSDIYVPAEARIWIAEQATWGTTIDPATGSWIEIQSQGGVITPDIKIHDVKADRGVRYKDVKDVHHSESGAMPKVSLTGIPIRKTDLARLLYLFFHAVTEGEATPFDKTFVLPTQPVDFASNEGMFCTVILKMPIASQSWKVDDCVCQHLKLSVSPAGLLMADIDLIGRGSVASTINPTATPSLATDSFPWEWELMDRFTYDVGGGDISPIPQSIEIDLSWNKVIPQGTGGSGEHANIVLDEFVGKITTPIAWSATDNALITKMQTKTVIKMNIGWGNATPGTDDKDLDFALCGTLEAVEIGRGDVLQQGLVVDLKADVTNTVVPITLIVADAEDKAW